MDLSSSERYIKELIKKQVLAESKINTFDLEKAKVFAERAEKKAIEMGISIVFSAVDSGGNILLVHRMLGSFLGSLDISVNKAYSAYAFKMSTQKIGELSLPGESLYGIQYTNGGRVVTFGGGLPYYCNGEIVGAIGVSGGTADEDMAIAEYILEES